MTISDQTSDDDIGRYAGWGSADDLHASAETDPIELRPVRSMGWRSYRGPGSGLMLLYPIGLFGLLVAELSLGVPALPTLLSLIALAAAFTIVARRLNRPPARASGGADRSATKHGAAAQGDGVVAQAAEFGPSRSDRPALAVDVAQADEKPTRNVAQKPPPPVEPPPGFTEGLTDALTTASLVQGENFSPDGLWCWDGTRWVSAISPDGLWRWDRARWGATAVRGEKFGVERNANLARGVGSVGVAIGLLGFIASGGGLSPGEFPALAYGSGVIALVLGVAGVATGALGRAVRKAYIAPALAIGLGVLILLAMSAVIEPQCAAGYCR